MNSQHGSTLIQLARGAIAQRLGARLADFRPDAGWLREHGATVVTLLHGGGERGRMATLRARRPIVDDVMDNAVAAACNDPRFQPLSLDELANTRIEVCLLSEPDFLDAGSESRALAALRPGIDGVWFEYGRHRSSFLPEQWRDAADAAEFIAQLKYKAGLPPDFWSSEATIARYTVTRWLEQDHKPISNR